eukprot:gene13040-3816_t
MAPSVSNSTIGRQMDRIPDTWQMNSLKGHSFNAKLINEVGIVKIDTAKLDTVKLNTNLLAGFASNSLFFMNNAIETKLTMMLTSDKNARSTEKTTRIFSSGISDGGVSDVRLELLEAGIAVVKTRLLPDTRC